MAPTNTHTQKEYTEKLEVAETRMFEREGFDRRGIRRELAGVTPIDLQTMQVEQEEREFVDPRTLDTNFGPTGMGELGNSSGMETVRVDGEEWRTFRYANGFEMKSEEDVGDLDMQIQGVLETFDFFADANLLKGVYDHGREQKIRYGVFDWLDSAIPSERVLDAEDFDGDASDEDYTGTEENLIKYEAFSKISGDLLTRNSSQWDLMLGRQPALANFQKVSEGASDRSTYFQRINDDRGMGGVSDMSVIPSELQLDTIPEGLVQNSSLEPVSVDLTSEIGDDEVYLIPDMDIMRDAWVRLSEMPSAERFGPYDLRQGRVAHDYVWRYSHKFDPEGRYPRAKDAVKITNVSKLFN